MNTLTRSLMGIALTAGAAYLLDPTSGHRRRLLLRDQCARAARNLELGTRDARQHAAERAQALVSRASHASAEKPEKPKSDRWVLQHTRRTLRQCASRPQEISLAVADGHVILRGQVLPHEHQRVLDEVREVPGVRIVTDHLAEHGIGFGPGALDAAHEFRPAAGGDAWTITSRVVAAGAGCALLLWGIKERRALGELGTSMGQRIARFSREQFERHEGMASEMREHATQAAGQARDWAEEKAQQWSDTASEGYEQSRRGTHSAH